MNISCKTYAVRHSEHQNGFNGTTNFQ